MRRIFSMDLKTLYKILAEGENDQVEFKERPDKIGKDVVAFLNTKGGLLLVGVDDKGNIVGVGKNAKGQIENILKAIQPFPGPFITIEEVKVGDKTLYALHIKPSPYLHFLATTPYVRVLTASIPLTIEETARRLAETALLPFDQQPYPYATIQDLSKALVERYLKKREEVRGVERPRLPYKRLLHLLGAVKGEHPTNGGLLFFSQHPQAFFPQAALRVRVVRSNITHHQHLIEGSLWQQWEEAIKEIERFLPKGAYLVGVERKEQSALHPFLYREGLANALIHRNYLDPSFTEVIIEENRLIITNPGGFPPGVTPEKAEHKPRNPLISRYFYDVGVVDKYGSGIERMRALAKQLGLPEPYYAEWHTRTTLVLPFYHPVLAHATNEIERALLSLLLHGPKTTGELAQALEKSPDTILRYLRPLLKRGIVKREGRGRSTRYSLTPFP